MLFSILIANYNNGHFFKECYQSILNQTYQNLEIIIVDDASTDNSVEVIKNIIQNDNRCKLFINEKNEKAGYTKNRCAHLSSGKICGFLDPDDTLEPNAIEVMINAHNEYPKTSIITSKHYLVDNNLNKIQIDVQGKAVPKDKSYLTYDKGALTHFATFKRESYLNTGGINPKFKRAVDQDLYYKLEEVGDIHFLYIPLYNYRINKNSISANENVYKAQYWHFVAIIDAYKRRNKTNPKLFSNKKIKKIKYAYYKERMQLETKKGNFCNKYYFLKKITTVKPFKQIFYKIKCLIFYKYA